MDPCIVLPPHRLPGPTGCPCPHKGSSNPPAAAPLHMGAPHHSEGSLCWEKEHLQPFPSPTACSAMRHQGLRVVLLSLLPMPQHSPMSCSAHVP